MQEVILKRLQKQAIACRVDGVWIIVEHRSKDDVIGVLKDLVASEKVAIVLLSDSIAILEN